MKNITAKEIFKKHPEVKSKPWGREFWTDGSFANTVSKIGDKTSISKYVHEQGFDKEHIVLHKSKQLALF